MGSYKRLFCDWQSEAAFSDYVLVSGFFAFTLVNLSHRVCKLMQTHAIPYFLIGFVACITRSRECNCPSYVFLGRNIILSIHEYIREFESNNPLECCHEVRIGK